MLNTTKVTEIIINKLLTNIDHFPVNTLISSVSEDSSAVANGPFIGIYTDFDEKCKILPHGIPQEIPISIYLLCQSGQRTSANESFDEALTMGLKTIKLLVDQYDVDINNQIKCFNIECKEKPILVIEKTALSSVVLVQLTYFITLNDI